MPVQYNLPENSAFSPEDAAKYAQLPYYLALVESKLFQNNQVFTKLFGKMSWQAKQGHTVHGIRGEPTPVGGLLTYPNPINQDPKKNVYETQEVAEDATIKWHDFDSKEINFLPSWEAFRENQVDFAHKDLVRQMQQYNENFLMSYILQKTPIVYVASSKGGNLLEAPIVPYGTDVTDTTAALAKNQAWFADMAAKADRNCTLAVLDNLAAVMSDDLGVPYYEGGMGNDKDNQMVQGKYVLVGSGEVLRNLKWDPDFSRFRNVNFDMTTSNFKGSIFDSFTYKCQHYPLRWLDDGTVITEPEITNATDHRTVMNPAYVNAPNEMLWAVGDSAFKNIKIGPPPSEFASKNMSKAKFYSMNWNGEIMITDQFLLKDANGQPSLNNRGRWLKLMSTLTMGAMPINGRYLIPVPFKRKRAAIV